MARVWVLPLLLRAAWPLPTPAPSDGSLALCLPEEFQCVELPEPLCLPREWLCDGHPDCDDAWDERGCGLNSTEASAVPGHSLPSGSQGSMWILVIAVLLSCLVAVGGIAAWGKSKAKSRSDVFGLEKASREQLMPHKPGRLILLKGILNCEVVRWN